MKYSCSCPDFQQLQKANPAAGSLSLQINRNWRDEAVSLNPPGFCKHIWATMRYQEEITAVPTDVPAITTKQLERKRGERMKQLTGYQGYGGGDFFGF